MFDSEKENLGLGFQKVLCDPLAPLQMSCCPVDAHAGGAWKSGVPGNASGARASSSLTRLFILNRGEMAGDADMTYGEPPTRRPGSRRLRIDGRARPQHDDQFSRHQLAGRAFKSVPILIAWSQQQIPQPSGLRPTRRPPRLQDPGHPHACGTGHQPWAPTSNSAGCSSPRLGHRPFLTSTGLLVRVVDLRDV